MQKIQAPFATAWAGLALGLAAGAPVLLSAAPATAVPTPARSAQGEARTVSVWVGRSHHFTAPWPVKGASLTDPNVADVQVLTPQLLLVTGKSVGTTNLLIWSEDGKTQESKVEVSADLSRLSADLGALFPSASLKVNQSQSVVTVSGTLERAEHAEQMHRYLDALKVSYVDMTGLPGVQQVQVEVRMAEVSRQALRALGVNGVAAGTDAFFGSNLGASNQSAIRPPVGATATGNVPFEFGPTNISPSVTLFGGLSRGDLEIFIQALAENQMLRVLAEPNLVAMSGSEASFLAGGEIPIPVVQGGGGGTASSISIQYKPFGVGLKFRPTVLGDGGIRLEVFSEVSQITDGISESSTQFGGIRVPGILTRRAETTLELQSGQTFAMAGLMLERDKATNSRVPLLGDLPVIGPLFRSVNYQRSETELLVLVSASLVEPVSTLSLPPMPGETQVEPTDWELYAEGRIESRVPGRAQASDQRWLKELGLDRLKGPGAWMSYGQTPAVSTAKPHQKSASGAQGDAPAPKEPQ